MKRVGKLTLNQNIANYFNEVEQLAFSPSHILPGEASCYRTYWTKASHSFLYINRFPRGPEKAQATSW